MTLLVQSKRGKTMVFEPARDLSQRPEALSDAVDEKKESGTSGS
jgi:hypothetical protein